MTSTKKPADKATEAKAVKTGETFAERQTRDTTEADNVVKGITEARDLKNEKEPEDEQTRINRLVEESQGAKGSTASKKPGPKYRG